MWVMKNGPYELIVAPPEYPGKKYRGRYAYEHIVVFWQNMGRLPASGHVVHHRNGDRRDNRWENLEEKHGGQHSAEHNVERTVERHNITGYTHQKCRCEVCRTAMREAMRLWRARTARRAVWYHPIVSPPSC
jgi:hypothetical protein